MNSKIYFNPSWAISRQGIPIPLWASHPPPSLPERASKKEAEALIFLPMTSTTESSVPSSTSTPIPNPILFVGGVHGDEPEGVWLAESLLNSLRTHYNRKTHHSLSPSQSNALSSATNPISPLSTASPFSQPWVLMTCLNPEGYAKNERTNSAGVDLNRNFPSPDWSAEAKAPRYHPGEKPASEPEVQGLMRAIEVYQPKLIIHFHSWKPCVVYTGAPAQPIAQILGEYSGYAFHEDIGYPTPGSLGQYGWLSKQIPVVCIEEQEGAAREHIWPRFQGALMDLLI